MSSLKAEEELEDLRRISLLHSLSPAVQYGTASHASPLSRRPLSVSDSQSRSVVLTQDRRALNYLQGPHSMPMAP